MKNIFKWHIHVFRYIDAHKEKTLCFKCEETKNKGFKRLSGRKFLLLFLYNSDLVLRMYGYENKIKQSKPLCSSKKNQILYLAGDSMHE